MVVYASDYKVWGVFLGNGYAYLRVIRMSNYIGANTRKQHCLLWASLLQTDASNVEETGHREDDMRRWCSIKVNSMWGHQAASQ